jgi:3-oxoacyl-[acyl-carrier protein] reductase
MTKTLAKEWGRYQVNVNAVAFGLIETRLTTGVAGESSINVDGHEIEVGVSEQIMQMSKAMIPLGRVGTAAEAAGAVYLFCLPEANYISGQTVVCGGGLEL